MVVTDCRVMFELGTGGRCPGGTNVHSTRSSQDRFARSVADKLPAIKARRGAAAMRASRADVRFTTGRRRRRRRASDAETARERERETIGAHRDGVVRDR